MDFTLFLLFLPYFLMFGMVVSICINDIIWCKRKEEEEEVKKDEEYILFMREQIRKARKRARKKRWKTKQAIRELNKQKQD